MDASQLTRMRAAAANVYVARQNPVDADMVTRNSRLRAAAQAFMAPYSLSNYRTAQCCPPRRSAGASYPRGGSQPSANEYGDSRLDEASFTGMTVNTFTDVMDRRAGAAICCGPPSASIPPQGIYLNATTPDAPYILLIETGNEFAIIYFTPPASDNGSPITNYRYSLDGGQTFTFANTTSSPIIIIGPRNGLTYQVVLQAVNGFGPGAFSRTIPAIMPYETAGIAQWATYLNNFNTNSSANVTTDMVCDNNYNLYVCGHINASGGGAGARAVNAYDASGTGQVVSPYYAPRVTFSNLGFLVKYNQAGTCQWVSMVDAQFADYSQFNRCIATDTQQNIYSAGVISNGSGTTAQSPTNFYDSSGFIVRQSPFSTNITRTGGYVYKIDSSGITQWVNFFSTGMGNAVMMTTDCNDNVYYGGTYRVAGSDQIPLLDVSGVTQSNSLYSIRATDNSGQAFLIKLNSSGKTQWSTYIPGAVSGGQSLAIDASNNIYCTVSYNAAITFLADASGLQQTTNSFNVLYFGRNDAHTGAALIKYNSDGKVQWCTCLTNDTSPTTPYSVKIDSKGNVYLTGTYTFGTTIYDASGFGQADSGMTLIRPTANSAAFMIKYNSSGKAQWAIRIDETGASPGFRYIDGFKNNIDSIDNIYIAGSILGPVTTPTMFNASGNTQVNSGITIPSVATGGYAGYFAKYNSNGICQWATYIDNSASQDLFSALTTDRSNSVYIGGETGRTITVQDVSGNTQTPSAIKISSIGSSASFIKYR